MIFKKHITKSVSGKKACCIFRVSAQLLHYNTSVFFSYYITLICRFYCVYLLTPLSLVNKRLDTVIIFKCFVPLGPR